jgi:MFS family permease
MTEDQEKLEGNKPNPDGAPEKEPKAPNPLREIIQPFVDVIRAPRALTGINVSYFLEGLVYFGILTILGKYMFENVGLSDEAAGLVYSFFTAGITLAMLFLGGVGDRIGIRRAMILALGLMLVGRLMLSLSSLEGLFNPGGGFGSPMFLILAFGLFIVVVGYGMYQPSSYAGVKKFTNKRTGAVAYAVIYALMNFGAFVSGMLSPPIRQSLGIGAVFWVYTFITFLAVMSVVLILTRKTEEETALAMKADREETDKKDASTGDSGAKAESSPKAGSEAALAAPVRPTAVPSGGWPIFLTAVVLVLGCVAGLIYSSQTRAELPAKVVLSELKTEAGSTLKIVKDVAGAVKKATDEAARALAVEPLKVSLGDLSGAYRGAVDKLQAPEDFAGTTDTEGLVVFQQSLQSEADYLADLRDHGLAYREFEPDKTVVNRMGDSLRAHGLFAMALAYSMVAEVDDVVMERLRKRFKDPGESIIPMPEALVREAVVLANKPLAEKLRAYGHQAEEVADAFEASDVGGGFQPVVLRIQASGRRAVRIADHVHAASDAARAVITDQLLADAEYSLELGKSLRKVEKEGDFMKAIESGIKTGLDWIAGMFGRAAKVVEKAVPSSYTYFPDAVNPVVRDTGTLVAHVDTVFPLPLLDRFIQGLLRYGLWVVGILVFAVMALRTFLRMRPDHPFNNVKFVYFIFILVPVQTLFAHNWLSLPYYINRAFGGTQVGDWFELFSNINPLLIFVLAPTVAALTIKANVFRMMIIGTLVMAAPTFLLALPPNPVFLLTYILIMSIGEAMWQPRFLQFVAELAPEGKTGIYMGIAQFPWFMTKMVTGFYSGWFVSHYCPLIGPQDPETMWFFYACIAMITPVALFLTSKWIQSGLSAGKGKGV